MTLIDKCLCAVALASFSCDAQRRSLIFEKVCNKLQLFFKAPSKYCHVDYEEFVFHDVNFRRKENLE